MLRCRLMPPIRPTRPVSGWWSPNHKPSNLAKEPPVTSAQPLWRLTKDGHSAEARVRPIEGIGLELRYEWNGDLRASQVFKSWDALEQAANEKRHELQANGWVS
jgi:hypothetical protein